MGLKNPRGWFDSNSDHQKADTGMGRQDDTEKQSHQLATNYLVSLSPFSVSFLPE